MCNCHSILECCVMFYGVKLSIRSFNLFSKKDGNVRYTRIKETRTKGYLTHDIPGSQDNIYTADNISKLPEFLNDNIFIWRMSSPPGYWNSYGSVLCSITS